MNKDKNLFSIFDELGNKNNQDGETSILDSGASTSQAGCSRIGNDNNISHGEIAAKAFKIAGFWEKCPQLWFIHIENVFATQNYKADSTKKQHVLAHVPEHIVMSVSDIIKNPNSTYEQLKDAIINRNSMSEEQRLNTLFSTSSATMGDRSPSELYRQMEQLADRGTAVDQQLLLKLWKRRLPKPISIALVSANLSDPDNLMQMADRVWEAMNNDSVFAIQQCTKPVPEPSQMPNKQVSELFTGMSEMYKAIQTLQSEVHELRERDHQKRTQRGRNFSRSHSRSRSNSYRSPSAPRQSFDYCWFHYKFGMKATKCRQPCKFSSHNEKN